MGVLQGSQVWFTTFLIKGHNGRKCTWFICNWSRHKNVKGPKAPIKPRPGGLITAMPEIRVFDLEPTQARNEDTVCRHL